MAQLRNNMASQAQMEAFLNAKAGGFGNTDDKTLDDIIQKKKIPIEGKGPRLIFEGKVPFGNFIKPGKKSEFKLMLQKGLFLEGDLKIW